MKALQALSALALVMSGAVEDAPWSKPWRDGAFTLEKRPVRGSSLSELRVTTESAEPPERLCNAAFEMATHEQRNAAIHLSRILRDGPDELVVYNQIHHAFITDRDYAMTVTRTRAGDGRCVLHFEITNDKAPPKPAGFIRMEKLRGHWIFERAGASTRITHTLFADPSGAIPAFVLEREAQETILQDVRNVFDLAHALPRR